MKLIIAGGRDFSPLGSFSFIDYCISRFDGLRNITEVVCGCAPGIDNEGAHWASHRNVTIKHFKADWNAHGKAAGPIRNKEMAEHGDVLLLIWDGKSKGSTNMRDQMLRLKKPVYEVILKNNG